MPKPKLKQEMEDIEKLLPEALAYVLLKDPHGHTKSCEPCIQWILDKEKSLRQLRYYLAERLGEIALIKIELQRAALGQREEVFYDHQTNRIYKRTLKDYGGYPDLRSFRQALQNRPERTSEEEGIPF